jgi:hypothetical protein
MPPASYQHLQWSAGEAQRGSGNQAVLGSDESFVRSDALVAQRADRPEPPRRLRKLSWRWEAILEVLNEPWRNALSTAGHVPGQPSIGGECLWAGGAREYCAPSCHSAYL